VVAISVLPASGAESAPEQYILSDDLPWMHPFKVCETIKADW